MTQEIRESIENIKLMVSENGGVVSFSDTIVLDSCDDENNLEVNEIIYRKGIDKSIFIASRFGLYNAEEFITDEDDWFTLEDCVNDELN